MYLYSDQTIKVQLSAHQLNERLEHHLKSPHLPAKRGEFVGAASAGKFSFHILKRSNKGGLEMELYGSYLEREGDLELTWNTRLSKANKIILFAFIPAGVLLFLEHKFIILWALVVVMNAFAYARERVKLHERLLKLLDAQLKPPLS